MQQEKARLQQRWIAALEAQAPPTLTTAQLRRRSRVRPRSTGQARGLPSLPRSYSPSNSSSARREPPLPPWPTHSAPQGARSRWRPPQPLGRSTARASYSGCWKPSAQRAQSLSTRTPLSAAWSSATSCASAVSPWPFAAALQYVDMTGAVAGCVW